MVALNSGYLEEVASPELDHVDLSCPGPINCVKYSLNHLERRIMELYMRLSKMLFLVISKD